MDGEFNPFPHDPDRSEIWEILIRRDLEAFLDADWAQTDPDFHHQEFWAIDANFTANSDHWRLRFPDLATYRDFWLSAARDFQKDELVGISKRDFAFQTDILRDIEINENRAVARKKFHGKATKKNREELRVNWQTIYFLKKVNGHWKISGFLGYLPNPMPGS